MRDAYEPVLLAIIAYLSTLSFALRIYSRAKLRTASVSESARKWAGWLEENESQTVLSIGVARLFAINVLAALIFHRWLSTAPTPQSPVLFVEPTLVIVGLMLLFALGIPNAIAVHAGERILALSLPVLWVFRWAMWPAERVLTFVDFVVRRLLGMADVSDEQQSELIEREILEVVSDGEAHGAVDEDQKSMIQSVIELNATTVSTIMTPRLDITGVPVNATYEDVRETILRVGHSRIPVFEKSIDHIVGVVYAKDLLRLRPGDAFDLRKIMRSAPYVPATKTLSELLNEFREAKIQIAIVLDEYGGTAGLATIEDILEELVGEIDDEYNQRPPTSVDRVDADTVEVDARVPVYEINSELQVKLPEDAEYETIGGFVFSTLGRIPNRGEQFSHENVQFHVVDAEPRRIKRLRLTVQREAPAAADA